MTDVHFQPAGQPDAADPASEELDVRVSLSD